MVITTHSKYAYVVHTPFPYQCPVDTDETGLRGGRGRFQTFTARAGMVAWRSEFPDGVHIVVLSLPDDEPCSLSIPRKFPCTLVFICNFSHISNLKIA